MSRSETGSTLSRFDALFAQLYPALFGLVYRVVGDRMETEDTLQEAFLKLADNADLQARPDDEVPARLHGVGLNHAFNSLPAAKGARARRERVGRVENTDPEPADNELSSPEGLVVRHEERTAVRRALDEVPERQRECLLLRHQPRRVDARQSQRDRLMADGRKAGHTLWKKLSPSLLRKCWTSMFSWNNWPVRTRYPIATRTIPEPIWIVA